jgi:hypothetical protein
MSIILKGFISVFELFVVFFVFRGSREKNGEVINRHKLTFRLKIQKQNFSQCSSFHLCLW